MKKFTNNFFIVALMVIASVYLTSCSSDDKDDNGGGGSGSYAKELEGTYTGHLGSGQSGEVIAKVTATGANSIKFEIISPANTGLAVLTTDVTSYTDNEILGTTTGIVALVYYVKEKNLSIGKSQGPGIYVFTGTKNK